MDASRYLAYEDGYLSKIAEAPPRNIMSEDQLRQFVLSRPDLRQHASLQDKYFDMASAAINKDWAMGMLSPGTNRKYLSGGLGLAGGAAIGGLLGGGSGAMVGGLLGALAGYLMDAFDIGLPDAYKKLFDARAKGVLKKTVESAAEELKAKGKGSTHANTVAKLAGLKTETAWQMATKSAALENAVAGARKAGNVDLERQLMKMQREHKALVQKTYVQEGAKADVVGAEAEAMANEMAPTVRGQMSKDLQDIAKKGRELELQIDERKRKGLPEANYKHLVKEMERQKSLFTKVQAQMKAQAPGTVYPGNKYWGALTGQGVTTGKIDLPKLLAGTKSYEEAEAIAQDILETRKSARDFYYPETGGTGWHWFGVDNPANSGDPNEGWTGNYAGLDPEYTKEDLIRLSQQAGAKWAQPNALKGKSYVDPAGREKKRKDLMAAITARKANKADDLAKTNVGGPTMPPTGRTAPASTPVVKPDANVRGPSMPPTGRVAPTPTAAAKPMVNVKGPTMPPTAPQPTPTVPDTLKQKQLQKLKGGLQHKYLSGEGHPTMWWEFLEDKHAAMPQDPGAVAETPSLMQGVEPPQTEPTEKDQFDFQREMANKQMDMQSKQVDMQKKVVDTQADLSKMQGDMTNTRMEMQNDQVQQAQQQATATNPAVNQSPQMPTATLNQPTAGIQPNAPTMQPMQ